MPHPNGATVCWIVSTCYDCSHAALPPLATCSKLTWTQSISYKEMVQASSTTQGRRCILVPQRWMHKNESSLVLATALDNDDALYWELEVEKPPSLNIKQPQAKEESINNSILTVKTAMSTKKMPKSTLKGSSSTLLMQKLKHAFNKTCKQWHCRLLPFHNWWKWPPLSKNKTKQF